MSLGCQFYHISYVWLRPLPSIGIVELRRQLQRIQRLLDRFFFKGAGELQFFHPAILEADGDTIPAFHLPGEVAELFVLEDKFVIHPGRLDHVPRVMFIGRLADGDQRKGFDLLVTGNLLSAWLSSLETTSFSFGFRTILSLGRLRMETSMLPRIRVASVVLSRGIGFDVEAGAQYADIQSPGMHDKGFVGIGGDVEKGFPGQAHFPIGDAIGFSIFDPAAGIYPDLSSVGKT